MILFITLSCEGVFFYILKLTPFSGVSVTENIKLSIDYVVFAVVCIMLCQCIFVKHFCAFIFMKKCYINVV